GRPGSYSSGASDRPLLQHQQSLGSNGHSAAPRMSTDAKLAAAGMTLSALTLPALVVPQVVSGKQNAERQEIEDKRYVEAKEEETRRYLEQKADQERILEEQKRLQNATAAEEQQRQFDAAKAFQEEQTRQLLAQSQGLKADQERILEEQKRLQNATAAEQQRQFDVAKAFQEEQTRQLLAQSQGLVGSGSGGSSVSQAAAPAPPATGSELAIPPPASSQTNTNTVDISSAFCNLTIAHPESERTVNQVLQRSKPFRMLPNKSGDGPSKNKKGSNVKGSNQSESSSEKDEGQPSNRHEIQSPHRNKVAWIKLIENKLQLSKVDVDLLNAAIESLPMYLINPSTFVSEDVMSNEAVVKVLGVKFVKYIYKKCSRTLELYIWAENFIREMYDQEWFKTGKVLMFELVPSASFEDTLFSFIMHHKIDSINLLKRSPVEALNEYFPSEVSKLLLKSWSAPNSVAA
ncbi:hypothetical protein MP638_001553, partial [Amoeboaphelidium occidentale]